MAIVCRDLAVEYAAGGYRIRPFDGLDLDVAPGELALLLGSSGCGKTTLLSVIAGMLRPLRGTVQVGGVDVTSLCGRPLLEYHRTGIGIIFQAFDLVPSLTALENVELPLLAAGVSGARARTQAAALLQRVAMSERFRHRPAELSGGEQQRVAIARALALDPPVLLADEPTAHLDYIQVEAVLVLLRELAGEGKTVVIATHDERFLPLGTQVVELSPRPAAHVIEPLRVELAPGETVFEQGDSGDRAYVIEEGEIEIIRIRDDGSEELVSRLLPGGNFGELAPMFGLRRSATARAATPARVVGLSVSDMQAWLAERAEVPERSSG